VPQEGQYRYRVASCGPGSLLASTRSWLSSGPTRFTILLGIPESPPPFPARHQAEGLAAIPGTPREGGGHRRNTTLHREAVRPHNGLPLQGLDLFSIGTAGFEPATP